MNTKGVPLFGGVAVNHWSSSSVLSISDFKDVVTNDNQKSPKIVLKRSTPLCEISNFGRSTQSRDAVDVSREKVS